MSVKSKARAERQRRELIIKTGRKPLLTGLETLEQIYAVLPKVACKGKCQECCGPVAMTQIEARFITDAGKSLPVVNDEMTCSHLTVGGRCGIYEHRPMVCRMWGADPIMPCPYGCVPDWVPDTKDTMLILHRLMELSGTADLTFSGGPKDQAYHNYIATREEFGTGIPSRESLRTMIRDLKIVVK